MDILLIHYKAIIAIIGSLTGLLALGITFYSKYRESNIKDKELELKKEQFDLEKKHQISKEKYQELFENKIDVYNMLYSEINKFRKQLYNVGTYFNTQDAYGNIDMEQLTVEDVNVTALTSLFKHIESNQFIISDELMDSYRSLYDLYRKHSAEFDFMLDEGAYGDPIEADEEWLKIRDSFYETYKKYIEDFFNQIEKEIKAMKKILEVK